MTEERLKILDMLRNGQISADEAERLLANVGAVDNPDFEDNQVVILPKGKNKGITYDESVPQFRNFWQWIVAAGTSMFLIFGLLVTSLTGILTLLCFGPFMIAGVLIAGIGLWSRSSHWIHVRVQDADGTNIKISLPFPIGFAGSVMRIIEPIVKRQTGDVNFKGLDIAHMIEMMGDELSEENPIMVAVDDDDDQVLVYIT